MTWKLPPQSSFTFGKHSEAELAGFEFPVHPKLQAVTRLALAISGCDFGIHDGVRTVAEGEANFVAGTSRTHHSKHQDGLAVDAVPWSNGKMSWRPDHCFQVAVAHQLASRFLRIPIFWGGAWDRMLAELVGTPKIAHQAYVERFERANPGTKALVDLVHFQLVVP